MCIIEAHTGKVPFDGFSDDAITDAAFEELPVCCPVGMDESIWALVKKMTRSHLADRIDMQYVNYELEKIKMKKPNTWNIYAQAAVSLCLSQINSAPDAVRPESPLRDLKTLRLLNWAKTWSC